jgi:hypothetical protein
VWDDKKQQTDSLPSKPQHAQNKTQTITTRTSSSDVKIVSYAVFSSQNNTVWDMFLPVRPSKTGGLEFQHLKLEAFF